MAGLFDTLALGSRSLTTYRKAIDTAGHNLANVNTPGYTRQRLVIESVAGDSDIGQAGAGAEATRIVQLKNDFTNQQMQVESSVEGSLEVRSDTLEQALAALQESVDRNGTSGTSTNGISQGLADFFASFQSLSTSPGSVPDRLVTLQTAEQLATKFNQVDARLASIEGNLNQRLTGEISNANDLTKDIANLNAAIAREEASSGGLANDLRDSRQAKLEELSRIIKIDSNEESNGTVNVIAAGVTLVDGIKVANTLETFDPGGGALGVRATGQTTPLVLTGGAVEGIISTRDNDISTLRKQVNEIAQSLITEVNRIHDGGFSLTGSTGEKFFVGTNASDIQVNSVLLGNPSLMQVSGSAGESGGNQIAVALAQLRTVAQSALDGQTFSDRQAQIVAGLGKQVATAKGDLEDQQSVSSFVKSQRDSVSGVSIDEEMSNLVMFQKAFQASAKLISMTDELLATIIQM